jgi:DNA ligase-1
MRRPMKGVQVTDFSKITFPKLASPKIDGFRCLLDDIARTSRMVRFPNPALHEFFQGLLPKGIVLDGEIVVGKRRAKGVLDKTKSVMRKSGEPDFRLWVFDAPRPGIPFKKRLKLAKQIVEQINSSRVRFVEHIVIHNQEELEKYLEDCLKRGFEGIMIRDPKGPYKEGKSTLREQWLLKIKPFEDCEARIINYFEEMENTNEAKRDATGKQKRSSAKDGKKPKGTLGGFIGLDLTTGTEVRVGGGFTAQQRKEFWAKRDSMIGQLMTYKKQTVGEKDKPRHPVFLGLRPEIDMDIDSV